MVYIQEKQRRQDFELSDKKKVTVRICNLLERQEITDVYAEIKQLQELAMPTDKIYLISAGGDGTLITILMDAKKNGVDIKELVCIALPYGTGNDTSRVLGFGGFPEGEMYSSLRNTVRELCMNSREAQMDLWSVKVDNGERGGTYQVDSVTREYKLVDNIEGGYQRYMINYFGLGEDGRIGAGFERNRTSSRCCNNIIYGWVGLKNCICCCFRGPTIAQ